MESPVQSSKTAGYVVPERKADCTGARPAWHSFASNTCDADEPDPLSFAGRQLQVPEPDE